MSGIPTVRFCYKLLVETLLTAAGFVARDEKDGLPFGIEGEGSTPFAVGGRETHLLHIGVLRAVERVGVWPTELRTEFAEQFRNRQQLGLNLALESQELRLEGVMQPNIPGHIASKLC